MNVVIWHCSIGSFLSIQHTLDCQISQFKWKRYEYVSMNPSSSSHVPVKRIDLLDDDIPISDFMDKFQSHIYKYIKHSHRSRWKSLEFKHFPEVFESSTILSVLEFAENCTFSPQREIQSEYYHSDQVSIFVHYCI